jgi:hypothetical protein
LIVSGFGKMLSVGAATVNAPFNVLLLPLALVPTVTLRVPGVALVAITQLAVTEVLPGVTPEHVTPPPPLIVTVLAPLRLLPLMVTDTVVPRLPLVGLIEVIAGAVTVNAPVSVLLLPLAAVVTVTSRAVAGAVVEITQLAVTCVPPAFEAALEHVTPVLDIVTPLAPLRLLPLMVTGTVVPRSPLTGLIDVMVGTLS